MKRATRALDKKYLKMTSEPLVQIFKKITEMFLMLPSTNIAQMVRLNNVSPETPVQIRSKFTEIFLIMHK